MSNGYDSTTAFSQSIGSIGSVAEDLLDRLKLSRTYQINTSWPILLIAHSLGGLIVKQAMNTAWFKIGDRFNSYGELLQNVRGLMFFGVPQARFRYCILGWIASNLTWQRIGGIWCQHKIPGRPWEEVDGMAGAILRQRDSETSWLGTSIYL